MTDPLQPPTAEPPPATDPQDHAPTPNPPPPLPGILLGPDGLRAGWGILLFILLFLGSGILVGRLHLLPARPHTIPGQPAPEIPILRSLQAESVYLALSLLATWILARIERRPLTAFGLGGLHRLRNFAQGLLWGFLSLSALVLTLWKTHLLAFDHLLLAPAHILPFALEWLAGFLVVALFEETFLRGYLQITLTRGLASLYHHLSPTNANALGFWTAALLLSAVFGLGHTSNPGESPIGLVSAAAAGLVFTLSLWRTGSLWWAIGMHTAWDWAQSFLFGVADSGTMIQHHLLASHPLGRALLSGGATGPEGSLYVLPTLALVALVITFTLPSTPWHTTSPSPRQPA